VPLDHLRLAALLRRRCLRVWDLVHLDAELDELKDSDQVVGVVLSFACIWVEGLQVRTAVRVPARFFDPPTEPERGASAGFRSLLSIPSAALRGAGAMNSLGVFPQSCL